MHVHAWNKDKIRRVWGSQFDPAMRSTPEVLGL